MTRIWGGAMAALGAAIVLASFLMSNTVQTEVPDPAYTYSVIMKTVETVNLAKLQLQTMVFQLGLFISLAGVVLIAAGLILEQIAGPAEVLAPGEPKPVATMMPTAPAPLLSEGARTPEQEQVQSTREVVTIIIMIIGGCGLLFVMMFMLSGGPKAARSSAPVNAAASAEANAASYDALAENMAMGVVPVEKVAKSPRPVAQPTAPDVMVTSGTEGEISGDEDGEAASNDSVD